MIHPCSQSHGVCTLIPPSSRKSRGDTWRGSSSALWSLSPQLRGTRSEPGWSDGTRQKRKRVRKRKRDSKYRLEPEFCFHYDQTSQPSFCLFLYKTQKLTDSEGSRQVIPVQFWEKYIPTFFFFLFLSQLSTRLICLSLENERLICTHNQLYCR